MADRNLVTNARGPYGLLSKLTLQLKNISDYYKLTIDFLFPLTQKPNAGQGRLMLEVSVAHAITHYSR
jgi:hypothetical protein